MIGDFIYNFMVRIVFIGNGFHNRIKILSMIENCTVDVINGIDEESIMNKLPTDVIDLFVVDITKSLFRKIITLIGANASINHIPVISLIAKRDLQNEVINDGDLFVSEFVTDIEFKYCVKAMIKMKLMDDELKKDKIVLELKVKERTKGLQESETKYRRIYNNVPDLVYTLDLKGTILTINDNVRNFGYEPEEVIGQNIGLFLNTDDLSKSFKNIDKKLINPNLTTKYLVDVKTKNDGLRTIEVKSHFIVEQNNTEIFVIARDVTDSIIAQKIIDEERERYRNMFDNMRSCVAIYKTEDNGENFIFTGINKSSCETEQVCSEDVLGKYIQESFPGLETTNFFKNLQKVYQTGKSIIDNPFYYENEKTGVKGWRENFIYKLKATNEVVAIYNDITDRVKYQEELKEAKDKAEQSDKIKSVFISNMSHEIRTPMNSIIGFTSLLEKETNPKKFKSYVDIITNSGNLLLTLIDDIMDLSKMESGNMKIKKTSFELQKLFKEIKEQFKLELDKREKINVNLITNVKKNRDVYTDYKRIHQVLNNLILNAIKFTTKGHIKYGFTIKGDFLEFYVEDTGIGIEEKNFDLVFNRFYQINREKIKKQEGTGLGLTICRAIVELLGGEIWIESQFGIGTIVYFTIPIEEAPIQDLIEEKEVKLLNKDICVDKRVLIIEDNNINYELLEIILLSSNMIVDRAINHLEFFDKIEDDTQYDLILLDIQLPGFDGWEILDWLKINKKEIPIIIQTAFASIENEIKALEMGAEYFVTKPINASDLLNKIRTICNNSYQQDS